MEYVKKATDGTRIAIDVWGPGSPIVVHGSLGSSADGVHVAEGLSGEFTVFLMNRRGRGPTGDAV